MKHLLNKIGAKAGLLALSGSFFLMGCGASNLDNTNSGPEAVNQPVTNINVNTSPSASPSPTPTPQNSKSTAAMQVTLPILDALFADGSFANDVKVKTGITDEQLQKLKETARNYVLALKEGGSDSGDNSTQKSTENAEKQIREVLGDDRAGKFLSFVKERLSAESEDIAAASPNAMPTDTRIVVNTPAYRMDMFKDGKLVKTYKIAIGYPEFPLPAGLRKASSIIFNPTWTPPDEPWVKGKFKPGQKVEAGSSDNPLGPIKIPIGLPSLIHGGKQASRLGAFGSHGCVGLTNQQVQSFALTLAGISATTLTLEDITAFGKQKDQTKEVKLSKPVPVELRYETIVVENGSLKIYRDVYERATNTEENLRKVLESYGVSLDGLPDKDREKILTGLKQMARNANGDPVGESNPDNTKTVSNSAKVTRTAKGATEFVFMIPALKGKGYPAPVNLKG